MGIQSNFKWRWTIVAVSIIVALTAVLYFLKIGPDEIVWVREIDKGNTVVRKIEEFRQQHGRLPNSMNEVGVDPLTSNQYFYQACDNRRYLVWFGTTLGESMTYDSEVRSWDSLNLTCQ